MILSSLHHPNVVSFYGIVRDGPDGSLATVTEFMVNGSLKQVLHKKDRHFLSLSLSLSLSFSTILIYLSRAPKWQLKHMHWKECHVPEGGIPFKRLQCDMHGKSHGMKGY